MMDDLFSANVRNVRLTYAGWNSDDRSAPGSRKPAGSLGVVSGLRSLTALAASMKSRIYLQDDYVFVNHNSRLSARAYGVRGIEGAVWTNRKSEYLLQAPYAAKLMFNALPELSSYGISGLQLRGFGDTLFSDHRKGNELMRGETRDWYGAALKNMGESVDGAGVYGGFAYTLPYIERILELPLDGSYHYLVDESVPFYPIVLHGYVTYSAMPFNLLGGDRKSILKSIEYGAIPAYVLTSQTPRLLKNTEYADSYSTRYEVWKDEIKSVYAEFELMAELVHLEIIQHEQFGEQAYMTTYSNGTKIMVDYEKDEVVLQRGGRS